MVAGVGPNLPPPTLQGLEVPGSAGPAARPAGPAPGTLPYAPQVTGGMPYAPQATGGMPYAPQVTGAMPYAPQVTGAMPAAPPYTMQPTGGVAPPQPTYSAQYTGASVAGMGPAAAAPASGSFPPLAPTDLQRYQASFAQLDADRDGFVTVRLGTCVFRGSGTLGMAERGGYLGSRLGVVVGGGGGVGTPQSCGWAYDTGTATGGSLLRSPCARALPVHHLHEKAHCTVQYLQLRRWHCCWPQAADVGTEARGPGPCCQAPLLCGTLNQGRVSGGPPVKC